jgi:hypothetical protein
VQECLAFVMLLRISESTCGFVAIDACVFVCTRLGVVIHTMHRHSVHAAGEHQYAMSLHVVGVCRCCMQLRCADEARRDCFLMQLGV